MKNISMEQIRIYLKLFTHDIHMNIHAYVLMDRGTAVLMDGLQNLLIVEPVLLFH